MNEDSSNWIEYLDNKVALHTMFSGTVPALDSLVLAQMVMDQVGGVHISLNFPDLPDRSPARWIAQGCDCVQLRLSFYDLDRLCVAGRAHEGNLDVIASFRRDNHFSISNTVFSVELVYRYVKAYLYPFDSRVFEEPQDWYRR